MTERDKLIKEFEEATGKRNYLSERSDFVNWLIDTKIKQLEDDITALWEKVERTEDERDALKKALVKEKENK